MTTSMMDTLLPSDATLEAVQNLLPQLCALADLFRVIADSETHGRMVDQLRTTAAAARESCEDARREWAALEAAKADHAAARERELAEHRQQLHAERQRHDAEREKREKDLRSRENWAAQQAAEAEADRQKAAELRADLEKRLAAIKAAAA